jgi:ribonuclease P protein component
MKNYTSLKLNKDFKKVYYRAKFKAHPLIVSYALQQPHSKIRFGITASKKIGNAVKRNRARRIIKAAFIECAKNLPVGYDYVFVAREKTVNSSTPIIKKIMEKQLIDILRGNK